MCLRFRFKIRLIIAFVLCLVGGIGEISSLVSFFMSMLCIFAVFERRENKYSPVATTSQPSTLRVAPSLSRAVTVQTLALRGELLAPVHPHRKEEPVQPPVYSVK